MRAGSKVSEVLSSVSFRTGLTDLVDRYNKRMALANDKVPLWEVLELGWGVRGPKAGNALQEVYICVHEAGNLDGFVWARR